MISIKTSSGVFSLYSFFCLNLHLISAQDRLDFQNLFLSCDKQDIRNSVIPDAATTEDNYHLVCDTPKWVTDTDLNTCLNSNETQFNNKLQKDIKVCDSTVEQNKKVYVSAWDRCFIRCKTGYSLESPNEYDWSNYEYDWYKQEVGVFTCRKVARKWQLFYWRYSDYLPRTDEISGPNLKSDFSTCALDDCFVPVTLLKANNKMWKVAHPRRFGSWKFKWVTQLSASGSFQSKHRVAKILPGVDENMMQGSLMLNLKSVYRYFPHSDFATNGFTVIVTMNESINGTFFVARSLNWNGHRDLNGNGEGRTFSFTSTYQNRNKLTQNYYNENANSTSPVWKLKSGKSAGDHRIYFDISFYAEPGNTLPENYQVEKVQLIEGEYANTECLTDKNTYKGYLNYDNSSPPNLYYGLSSDGVTMQDYDVSRKIEWDQSSHGFNPVGTGCDKSLV